MVDVVAANDKLRHRVSRRGRGQHRGRRASRPGRRCSAATGTPGPRSCTWSTGLDPDGGRGAGRGRIGPSGEAIADGQRPAQLRLCATLTRPCQRCPTCSPATPRWTPSRPPTCSNWWPSGSCCRTCPSPTCCCGCPPAAATGRVPVRGPVPADHRADRLPARPGRGAADRPTGRRRCRSRSPSPGSSASPIRTGRATPRSGARRSRSCSSGRTIAVLGRDSNLTSVRSPSQLELAYLQSAADLASMVATGQFPGPASQREEAAGPRVGDGMIRVDAARPGALRQPERLVGAAPAGLQRQPAGRAVRRRGGRRWPAIRSRPPTWPTMVDRGAARRAPEQPRGRQRRRRDRAVPGDPAAPAGRIARRAGAAAGRHRAAPPGPPDHEQGRDHPRDPPSGEEQPADGGRAAAAAVAPGRQRRGPDRAGGVHAPGVLDRAGARDAVLGDRRGGRLRRGGGPAAGDAGRGDRRGRPGPGPADRHRSASCRPSWPRRW